MNLPLSASEVWEGAIAIDADPFAGAGELGGSMHVVLSGLAFFPVMLCLRFSRCIFKDRELSELCYPQSTKYQVNQQAITT